MKMGGIETNSLYRVCVASVAENIKLFRGDLKNFPAQQVCDVYKQVIGNLPLDLYWRKNTSYMMITRL